jgi:REP element-mobilizing transposase RayT
MDRLLDEARFGPTWLRQQELARLVADAIQYGAQALNYYQLCAYVVMANHVHLLVLPRVNPSKLLHSLKGFTAREANRTLHRTGEPFWQRESYDHWIRDEREFERVRAYIENNPVRVGLVARAEDYPWSSAARAASG